jgi:hypothetical protein
VWELLQFCARICASELHRHNVRASVRADGSNVEAAMPALQEVTTPVESASWIRVVLGASALPAGAPQDADACVRSAPAAAPPDWEASSRTLHRAPHARECTRSSRSQALIRAAQHQASHARCACIHKHCGARQLIIMQGAMRCESSAVQHVDVRPAIHAEKALPSEAMPTFRISSAHRRRRWPPLRGA